MTSPVRICVECAFCARVSPSLHQFICSKSDDIDLVTGAPTRHSCSELRADLNRCGQPGYWFELKLKPSMEGL
jgi:hypothetical protein